jgi:hypothetical protein
MKNLVSALIKFQKEVPVIPKNKINPFFNSYYAELSTVIDTCSPVLNKHGLAVVQTLKILPESQDNALVTILCHESGETLESHIYLPKIMDSQKLTASITYLRRSAYLAITGLVADSDDDGNSLVEKPKQQANSYVLDNPSSNTVKPASTAQLKLVADIAKRKNIPAPDIKSSSEASKWINDNK